MKVLLENIFGGPTQHTWACLVRMKLLLVNITWVLLPVQAFLLFYMFFTIITFVYMLFSPPIKLFLYDPLNNYKSNDIHKICICLPKDILTWSLLNSTNAIIGS